MSAAHRPAFSYLSIRFLSISGLKIHQVPHVSGIARQELFQILSGASDNPLKSLLKMILT